MMSKITFELATLRPTMKRSKMLKLGFILNLIYKAMLKKSINIMSQYISYTHK